MTTTPTLDPERTDRLRTFLVTEAAADVAAGSAARRPTLTPARRRALAGAVAVLVLGGAFVAAEAVGGPAPAAIAVEVDGEWTTIRLVDIDADPDAVVAELVAAGFAAERQTLEVVHREGSEVTEYSVYDVSDPDAPAVVGVGSVGEGGDRGLVGLSVQLPEGAVPAGAPVSGGRVVETDEVPAVAGPGGVATVEDGLLGAGVRFEADGGISVRAGADVTIVVSTER
jgi:hypothetical protein